MKVLIRWRRVDTASVAAAVFICFHLFRFAGGEKVLLAAILLLGGAVVAACAAGSMSIYYYPAILLPRFTVLQWISLAAYLGLMSIPMVLDMRGIHEWKLSHAAM